MRTYNPYLNTFDPPMQYSPERGIDIRGEV